MNTQTRTTETRDLLSCPSPGSWAGGWSAWSAPYYVYVKHHSPWRAFFLVVGTEWELRPNLGAVCAQSAGGVNLFNTLQVIQWVCDPRDFVVTYDAERMGASIKVNPKGTF